MTLRQILDTPPPMLLLEHPYAEFISLVDKPARYLGGEFQSVRKDWSSAEVRIALAFPDVYEIGMSHLGTKILYSLLSKDPRILCERAFTPWVDMERELRKRKLPLVSLESARPLKDFDVVGMSLQYELTYTNCLTLLELGGIPLRAEDRGEDDPLVLAGGPVATHPEPIAPFFDCILIGEAEKVLPDVLLDWARWKKEGIDRRERLIRLSQRGYLYVPSLYSVKMDADIHRQVVDQPIDPRVPGKVNRVYVPNLNEFPFPSDTPVPYAEAIFDRASIEIARGCTEGCRFCQAGMIYRPVRERDPESIVESVVQSVKRGGYDETSLTSLSTADFSCILPLMKKVMGRLREERVSLSVSSLRAYGLSPEILDEMSSVRATGLTFAPEAGTQRMRDVINKNITEEDIARSA
ncbi:MAG TPA: TIGR03960 family B12-binding radical SAM protein, partial [Pseudomonadota bacterium]|nr:TIGR03960 family B12-binding radical SAM protein [Pseudomonadota bacterium]